MNPNAPYAAEFEDFQDKMEVWEDALDQVVQMLGLPSNSSQKEVLDALAQLYAVNGNCCDKIVEIFQSIGCQVDRGDSLVINGQLILTLHPHLLSKDE